MKPEHIKAYLEYLPQFEVSPASAWLHPNNCAVVLRTSDNVRVGACLHYLTDGITCPVHGKVKKESHKQT